MMVPRGVQVMVATVMALALTGAWAQLPSELDKYSYMKVMMSCLGSRAVIEWRRQMMTATEKCTGGPLAVPPTLDLTQYLEKLGVTTPVTPTFIQFPVYQAPAPARSPQYTHVVPQYTQVGQLYQPYQYNTPYQVYQPNQYSLASQYLKGFLGFRARRGSGGEAEDAQLKEALTARMSNITCILREVKMLDANDQVNYDHVRQEILGLVAGELREELSSAEGSCRAFSRCLPPPGPAAHPVARHLGQAVVYYRCLGQKMLSGCMRNDLRKLGSEIGWLSGDMPLASLLETPILQQVEDIMLGPSGIPDLLL
ncbi:uncharacterized protein LOC127007724 [Eriocheir sinensis]|uniref:uncharacterized protein LOC127007724 n=1 Tax=Eriocheir sinensis TaxID=95602 RepID=UPI0021CAC07E|nr:uncharacterized protein LOC127007724 [Eriocheir sinensis]